MTAPVLTLAVPSKGRLQENAFSFFARAGLKLVQGRGARVPVLPSDTPETLAARVLTAEHALYPRALAKLVAR